MHVPDTDGVGPSDEVAAWVDRIRWLLAEGARIDLVQVYLGAPPPTHGSAASTARLEEIAQASALGSTLPPSGSSPRQES